MDGKKKTGRISEKERQERRELFRYFRKAMGLTQAELALFLNSHKDNISVIETGGSRKAAPTKQQMATMRNLFVIYKHGLLPVLLKEISTDRTPGSRRIEKSE